MDDVLNKDNDFIINYFEASTKTSNNNNKKESSPLTTDEGFHSNENYSNDHSNNDDHATNDTTHSNSTSNKKKLLFSSHAQFSRDFSLDDGVEESIVVSEIEPTMSQLLNDPKDGEKTPNFQLPSVTNEVYVKICRTGSLGSENSPN